MGYTHYWDITKISQHSARFTKAVGDMAKVIRNSPVPLAGPLGTGKPKLAKTYVSFNGATPNDYESFLFPDQDGFCKTAKEPYDVVVIACLAIAKDVFGEEIRVRSDGGGEDWDEGVRLASSVLGREIDNPIEPRRGLEGACSSGSKRFVLLDDGGVSADRYTLLSAKPTGPAGREVHEYIGFNEHPYSPQGFGQHGEIGEAQFKAHKRDRFRALGKPILFSSLPSQAQKFAKKFMDELLESKGP
jgi:hypothetical protein